MLLYFIARMFMRREQIIKKAIWPEGIEKSAEKEESHDWCRCNGKMSGSGGR